MAMTSSFSITNTIAVAITISIAMTLTIASSITVATTITMNIIIAIAIASAFSMSISQECAYDYSGRASGASQSCNAFKGANGLLGAGAMSRVAPSGRRSRALVGFSGQQTLWGGFDYTNTNTNLTV